MDTYPFSREEALQLWARLIAGWAHSLNADGTRTHLDGYPNYADQAGSYEGVTRMLWGLGGWLSQPERAASVAHAGETFDLEVLARRALVNGCDPDGPTNWGRTPVYSEYDQRTVESGQIAFVLWQTRERLWNRLSEHERQNITDFLIRFGQRPSQWANNWALFWALNHACRKALQLPYDQDLIDDVTGPYLDGVYCGDGWYDDGPARGVGHFDDYNTWVFASHVLLWASCDTGPRRAELLGRVRQWMVHYPYFFAEDGAYAEFGRSLAYKFARLGAPLWAYQLGVWPHSAGMLRRLVGRHLRWYVDRGAVRRDGTLRQTLTADGSPEICESYIATGSTYWAMQAFGGLWSLPDNDPFWTVDEEPLPAEQGDYRKIFPQPGWVLQSRHGQVHRYNAGSVAHGYGQKYAKFVYSTQNSFNVGLTAGSPAPDSMLCLVQGQQLGQRTRNLAYAVGEPGWLRMRYEQTLNRVTYVLESIILIGEDYQLRVHRLLSGLRSLSAVEGAAASGYGQGYIPEIASGPGWSYAAVAGKATAIRGIRGYNGQSIWQGSPSINSVYPHYVVPVLTVSDMHGSSPGYALVCLVYAGPEIDPAVLESHQIDVGWDMHGTCTVQWNGTQTVIAPLS